VKKTVYLLIAAALMVGLFVSCAQTPAAEAVEEEPVEVSEDVETVDEPAEPVEE
jgi:hypothetical protein